MMFLTNLSGMLEARITGADPGRTLARISQQGVVLQDIRWEDDLTVRLRFNRKDRKSVASVCQKHGDDVRFFAETGILYLMKAMLARPVLTMGIFVLFALTAYIPTRVLFVRVEGNSAVPERRILEAVEQCGIRFGASRQSVRSEQMKNKLLDAVPELKWAGINTAGCTAVISVREHVQELQKPVSTGVSSIVAARDGRIISCTVTRGNGLCVPGQVVQEGQILISGYTDCGICIRVTEADGEIFAETRRETRTVTPMQRLLRREKRREWKRYGLVLGKKRINLWKGSGISPATCGRMYEEYYITLPGGFRLPVCLTVETLTDWEIGAWNVPPETLEPVIKSFSRKSVLDSSIAGSILQEDQKLTEENGCYVLESSFFCSEMIGRVITEEIGETNGKTD